MKKTILFLSVVGFMSMYVHPMKKEQLAKKYKKKVRHKEREPLSITVKTIQDLAKLVVKKEVAKEDNISLRSRALAEGMLARHGNSIESHLLDGLVHKVRTLEKSHRKNLEAEIISWVHKHKGKLVKTEADAFKDAYGKKLVMDVMYEVNKEKDTAISQGVKQIEGLQKEVKKQKKKKHAAKWIGATTGPLGVIPWALGSAIKNDCKRCQSKVERGRV